MQILEIFPNAFRNLAENKLRSSLTMLGVIIGVASVIAMSSIVEGGKNLTVDMIEKMGTHLLSVRPKKLTEEELRAFVGHSKGLRLGDAEAVRQTIPYAKAVTPVINFSSHLTYEDRAYTGMVEGVQESYREIRNHDVASGRFLVEDDLTEFKKVVVLGQDVVKELFKTASPLAGVVLGAHIKVADHRFTVIGVLKEKGALHGINYDETVLIPASTAIKFIQGDDKINSFIVKVDERQNMKKTDQRIRTLLLHRHDGVEDFSIRSQDELLRNTEMLLFTFRVILGGTAALSLLVGGIGIMNIMLVTVTERTAEIGLRKAIGASSRAILIQFLIESVAISMIGGIIGILFGSLLGLGFGWLAGKAISGWTAVILPSAIFLGFSFAVAVGVTFGLYPAYKASQFDPAEALRYQ